MRLMAWLVLTALLAVPALAQTSDQPPAAPSPASPGAPDTTKLPLAAMRHEQPRRDETDARERARYGATEPEVLKRQRAEEDQLYKDIMRRSAPAAEGQ